MRRSIFGLIVGAVLASAACADDRVSIGIGAGPLNAGLGVNVAMTSDRDFKFFALGCIASYRHSNGHSGNACGVGVGWLRTDWFSGVPSKHGLGAYIGPVAARRTINDDNDGNEDLVTRYGAAMSYVYFFSGAGKPGFHLGVAPAAYRVNGATKGDLLVQLGYQF